MRAGILARREQRPGDGMSKPWGRAAEKRSPAGCAHRSLECFLNSCWAASPSPSLHLFAAPKIAQIWTVMRKEVPAEGRLGFPRWKGSEEILKPH